MKAHCAALADAMRFLGLGGEIVDPRENSIDASEINTFIAARAAARTEKNWAEADRIRDELDAMGIQLKDAKDPDTGELVTTWEVKR